MGPALGLIGFLGGIAALIWLVVVLIRKKPKRIPGLALLGFFVLFVLGIVLTPVPEPTPTATLSPTPTPTPTATPSPIPTPTPDLVADYRNGILPLIAQIQAAFEGIVDLAEAPAYSNLLWRERMFGYAQDLIDAQVNAQGLNPPAKWQDAHEALLLALSLYREAAENIQVAMIAYNENDIPGGNEFIRQATSLMNEAAAHLGFAAILIEEV